MKRHSLIDALVNLRGNPRGCVYTEPLWGIPFNLYTPYVSIYMIAIGLTDAEIGTIASVGLIFQVVFALLSGIITDKLGRRRTTLIFDIFAWSVPALISAVAQNFWYFWAAAAVNSLWRITYNSWSCLLVEDADPEQLVDIYSWIYIANLIVGFISPLAGALINIFTLVPTVRGLYFFAAIMFTIKAVTTYLMTEETAQGKVRMHETKHQSLIAIFSEYRHVLRAILRAPQTLYTAGIMLIFSITTLISGNFWAIIVTKKILISDQALSIFPFLKSGMMILFFFFIMPHIRKVHFKIPLTVGFLCFLLGQICLMMTPEKDYVLLVANVLLDACGFATVGTLIDRMTATSIEPKERARILSILAVGVILLTSPFGWIAGELSAADKDWPFLLNIVLYAAGAWLAYRAGQSSQKIQPQIEPTAI